jgi:hypothetical protein
MIEYHAVGDTERTGAMAAEYSFDDDAISRTIERAQQRYAGRDFRAAPDLSDPQSGTLRLRAQCISVVSGDNEVCLRLPLGLGKVCLPLPFDLPDGTAAQACLSICHGPFNIPTGVCVTVRVGGVEVVEQCFGFSC